MRIKFSNFYDFNEKRKQEEKMYRLQQLQTTQIWTQKRKVTLGRRQTHRLSLLEVRAHDQFWVWSVTKKTVIPSHRNETTLPCFITLFFKCIILRNHIIKENNLHPM